MSSLPQHGTAKLCKTSLYQRLIPWTGCLALVEVCFQLYEPSCLDVKYSHIYCKNLIVQVQVIYWAWLIHCGLLWIAVHLEKLPQGLEGARGCACLGLSFPIFLPTSCPPLLVPIHRRWQSSGATSPMWFRQRSSLGTSPALAETEASHWALTKF